MSILNFPRIYFNGQMFWNPTTANNNDVFPTYDAINIDMNWKFLEPFGVTKANAAKTLQPWMITAISYDTLNSNTPSVLQVPGNGDKKHYPYTPAEWNMFGDSGCGATNYNDGRHVIQSLVSGGALQANVAIERDTLIGKNYQIMGNGFGGRDTAARMVDINPWINTFTALYFDKFILGDNNTGVTMNRQYRMLDRFLNFNWGALGGVTYATTIWQTCFPKDHLVWHGDDSALLKELKRQVDTNPAVQGVMVRFSTYLTCYDKNGIFNNNPPVLAKSTKPCDLEKLQAMYEAALKNPNAIFSNPAYSRTAGTVGLWYKDEFPTAPAGKRLIPTSSSATVTVPSSTLVPTTLNLGVLSAEVNGLVLSMDASVTFPFTQVDAAADIPEAKRFDVGTFDVGVMKENNQFKVIGTLAYADYGKDNLNKQSGLIDLTLAMQQDADDAKNLPLQLRQNDQIFLEQSELTAEVIESGSFINVGDEICINVMVQRNGKPAKNQTLRVAEYGNPFLITNSNYYLALDRQSTVDFVLYYNHPQDLSKNILTTPQFQNSPRVKVGETPVAATMNGHVRDVFQPASTNKVATTQGADPGIPVTYKELMAPDSYVGVSLNRCLDFLGNGVSLEHNCLEDKSDSGTVVYQVATLTTNDAGIAQIRVRAINPGFPSLRFFFDSDAIVFSFDFQSAYLDFMAPMRVLPMDATLDRRFVEFWNSCYQDQNAPQRMWDEFIFPEIMLPFYYLYPIMNKFMPLNDLVRLQGAIDQLIVLISDDYEKESTMAMPITRDLPESRRKVLLRWATELVKMGYPPEKLA